LVQISSSAPCPQTLSVYVPPFHVRDQVSQPYITTVKIIVNYSEKHMEHTNTYINWMGKVTRSLLHHINASRIMAVLCFEALKTHGSVEVLHQALDGDIGRLQDQAALPQGTNWIEGWTGWVGHVNLDAESEQKPSFPLRKPN
jgi:hypothetical protein